MEIPAAIRALPHVNATLNALCAALLVVGYWHIRARRIPQHRAMMIAAFATSILFLASYLTYHLYPGVGTVRFEEPASVRPFYLSVLIPHTVLAAAVPPLALVALVRGLRGRYSKHRAVARWALPVWLFVSATGVTVYVMLYVLFPQAS
ncbi:DUF420 domain-containing protein [Candidatus Poribacteria bacterium]|nr:DUF420 domain-containing protein [Candidatus Poribacteria bacterium]